MKGVLVLKHYFHGNHVCEISWFSCLADFYHLAILVVPTVSFSVHCFKFLFIFCSSGIQKQISTSSTVRKLVALTFIRISLAYMELKRIYEV